MLQQKDNPTGDKNQKKKEYDVEVFRYTLYSPNNFLDFSGFGFNTFDEKYNQGKFQTFELAKKAAAWRPWWQIVDNYENKVIEQKEVDIEMIDD